MNVYIVRVETRLHRSQVSILRLKASSTEAALAKATKIEQERLEGFLQPGATRVYRLIVQPVNGGERLISRIVRFTIK